ncbi:hypothetical protein [Streptomyces sp. NPDC059814]|uniref:hypothetical protein n=1 Tax=Streptomyces sp. NPDC059814 TaxID=3346959 RepID=UPI00365EDFA0
MPETVKHHLVVTIQIPGRLMNTRDEVLTIPADYTRSRVYAYVLERLVSEYGTDDIAVLFYSLEPEQL